MANKDHLKLLSSGIEGWNEWRMRNPRSKPLLDGAVLDGADLKYANLSGSDLRRADLASSYLNGANLQNADLTKANLRSAYIYDAILDDANLTEVNLQSADLTKTKLRRTTLVHANLVDTNFEGAVIEDSAIYGISAWNVHLTGATQSNLRISPPHEPAITVDNLKLAQFIYLILNNAEINEVINATTSKAVLILGRFEPPERKAVLLAIRDELRRLERLPIIFDFDRPTDRSITETVRILGSISLCVVADLTDPKSVGLELEALGPHFAIPFILIHHESQQPFSMSSDLKLYDWFLDPVSYSTVTNLVQHVKGGIIGRAETKRDDLRKKKERKVVSTPISESY
jgi:hypothetical protein